MDFYKKNIMARLTESDINRIVKKVIKEQEEIYSGKDAIEKQIDYYYEIFNNRDLNSEDLEELHGDIMGFIFELETLDDELSDEELDNYVGDLDYLLGEIERESHDMENGEKEDDEM